MPTNNDAEDFEQKAELYASWTRECPNASGLIISAYNGADGLVRLKVEDASHRPIGIIPVGRTKYLKQPEIVIRRALCGLLAALLSKPAQNQ